MIFGIIVLSFILAVVVIYHEDKVRYVGLIGDSDVFAVYSVGLFRRKVYRDRHDDCYYEDGSRATISDACAVASCGSEERKRTQEETIKGRIKEAKSSNGNGNSGV